MTVTTTRTVLSDMSSQHKVRECSRCLLLMMGPHPLRQYYLIILSYRHLIEITRVTILICIQKLNGNAIQLVIHLTHRLNSTSTKFVERNFIFRETFIREYYVIAIEMPPHMAWYITDIYFTTQNYARMHCSRCCSISNYHC